MRKFFLIVLLLKLLPCTPSVGQQFYRVRADFSIKEKTHTGSSSLIMGTVYYDKAVKKVTYQIKFPKKEIWVIDGDTFYSIVDNKIVVSRKTPVSAEQSIFNLTLNGELNDYGLKNSIYKLETVEKENDKIISTWLTEPKNRKVFGKVMISQTKKKLSGLVFFNPTNEIVSKQFFKSYINVDGCEFPTEINQISYLKTGRDFRSTSYRKVIINENINTNWYNFIMPK